MNTIAMLKMAKTMMMNFGIGMITIIHTVIIGNVGMILPVNLITIKTGGQQEIS